LFPSAGPRHTPAHTRRRTGGIDPHTPSTWRFLCWFLCSVHAPQSPMAWVAHRQHSTPKRVPRLHAPHSVSNPQQPKGQLGRLRSQSVTLQEHVRAVHLTASPAPSLFPKNLSAPSSSAGGAPGAQRAPRPDFARPRLVRALTFGDDSELPFPRAASCCELLRVAACCTSTSL
jgi:hypothetical protein